MCDGRLWQSMQSMRRLSGLVDLRLASADCPSLVYSVTLPLSIFHAYLRDNLPLFVGGKVGDLVGDVHVPVNALTGLAQARIAAAGLNQHANDARGVLLVGYRSG